MKKSKLKLISSLIINESNTNELEKKELFKLVENSSKEDLINFIKENQTVLNELITPKIKSFLSISGATTGFGIPFVIYRAILSLHGKCTRNCGRFEYNTIRRQVCMVRCKIDKYEKMLEAAKKHNASSNNIKDLQNKINKYKKKLAEYMRHAKRRGTSY